MIKKLILLIAVTFSTASYSQLTDANFQQAINDCLATNPVDGLCTNSPYGIMPDWDVSQVTNPPSNPFNYSYADFNVDISSWDVSNMTTMVSFFAGLTNFNQDLNNWDVSNVTDMSYMFKSATSFNGDISNWNVSSVTTMTDMFRGCNSFSGNLSSWNLTNLTNMNFMFAEIDNFNFNINLWNWDTSNVTTMRFTFYDSQFDQDISSWDVSNVTDMNGIFSFSGLSTNNYDLILNGWSQQNLQSAVTLQAYGVYYCNGEDARQSIIDNYGWVIVDAGLDCSTAGIDDQNQLDISIYPNPTSDIVYIEGNYSQLKAVVYDILGKQVINKSVTNSIDISQLEKGVYILQLSDGAKLTTQRIVKD